MQRLSVCLLFLFAVGLTSAQNCPSLWASDGNFCYRFFKEGRTYQEAMDHCAKFSSCATGVGASLAKLSSSQEETGLARYLSPLGSPDAPNIFLGLANSRNTGTFTWPDGTTTTSTGYQNFGQGPRNGNCVLRDNRMRNWMYASCTQPNAFVCQMERVQPEQPVPGTPTRPV